MIVVAMTLLFIISISTDSETVYENVIEVIIVVVATYFFGVIVDRWLSQREQKISDRDLLYIALNCIWFVGVLSSAIG